MINPPCDRRCYHCDMPLDGDQRCPHCGSETPDDVGALVAELRGQYGRVAGELVDATMTMWHLEPGDRSDMPLAERITTLVAELRADRDRLAAEQNAMQARLAELARQRDAAAAERDRVREQVKRCVWIDPRRQSGTPCLGGTRISAYIIARLIADGTTAEQIRDMYPDVTDGHLRAVAAFMAERDTARRDGAADALELFAAEHPLCSGHHRAQLNAWAVEVRAGGRTIPTTEGDNHA